MTTQQIKAALLDDWKQHAEETKSESWWQELTENEQDSQRVELFYYWHTYYAETAAFGDTGEIIDAMQELIEEHYGEQWPRPKDMSSLQFANHLVNVAAEIVGPTFMY